MSETNSSIMPFDLNEILSEFSIDTMSDVSVEEDIIDEIYNFECFFLDEERQDKKYYIGSCSFIKKEEFHNNVSIIDPHILLLNSCISSRAFFLFPFKCISMYLNEMNIAGIENQPMTDDMKKEMFHIPQILQIYIVGDTYTVIIKTFWLRIVQRCWKKTFLLRKQMIHQRKMLKNLKYFEINGKWMYGTRHIPSYKGCVWHCLKK